MTMNKARGNMYGDIDFTWNPISGQCPHECAYCYVRGFWARSRDDSLKLKRGYFADNLGRGRRIFVGSSTDMFAAAIPEEWIAEVLQHLSKKYPDNEYLFQSKNPGRFREFLDEFPPRAVLATTIETNREDLIRRFSRAPTVKARVDAMQKLKEDGFKTQVTIEPIMDFDLKPLADLVRESKAGRVYIGADSKNSKLPEPSAGKILALIRELLDCAEVKLKRNIARLGIRGVG